MCLADVSILLPKMVNNYVPRRQVSSCSMTRPPSSLCEGYGLRDYVEVILMTGSDYMVEHRNFENWSSTYQSC